MNKNLSEDRVISFKKTVEDLEKRLIIEALKSVEWCQARAARRLDISQRILGYKMRKYGIPKKATKV
jgi:Nif-specific regulatory protein